MKDNLLVGVLGNRNSGKSLTWNLLFGRGRSGRTGPRLRKLYLNDTQYVEVFLVSGSPDERHEYVGNIIGKQVPRIVLCSMQYHPDVAQTIQYFAQHDYSFFVHWLNPGYYDLTATEDSLGLLPVLRAQETSVNVRDGKVDATERVQEMREFIFEWASSRFLVREGKARRARMLARSALA